MYAETLITPHPRKHRSAMEAQPLLEKINCQAARGELQDAYHEGIETYDNVKIEVAEAIAADVNKALWYPEKVSRRDDYDDMGLDYPLSLDEIENKQAANCFGYTVATSELLDEASIEHWIGYGNGHAFLLVPSSQENSQQSLYLIDPLTPGLNQTIDTSMRRGDAMSVRQQLEVQDRGAFMLDTASFSQQLNHSPGELAKKHPWLVFAKNQSHYYHDHRDTFFNGGDIEERNRLQRMYMIIVSAYEAADGRQMIEDYASLQRAVATDNLPQACASIRSMAGSYPELDARQRHSEFRQVIDALLSSGQAHLAIELIEPYFKSFEVSGDSRFLEAKADIKRRVVSRCVATALDQEVAVELIHEAVDEYEKAAKNPNSFRSRIHGKLEESKQLAQQLVP